MAISQLVDEYTEEEFLTISYHHDDYWSTDESEARINWYFGLPGGADYYPTLFFDGGADNHYGTGNCYNTYNQIVQEHLMDDTPVIIEAYGAFDGDNSFINIVVTLDDILDYDDVNVRMVIKETGLTYESFNQYNAARLFLPEEALTISSAGESQEIYREFSLDSDWDMENLSVIVFVQSDNFEEEYPILQSQKMIEAGSRLTGVVNVDGRQEESMTIRIWSDDTVFKTYAESDGSYLLHLSPGEHTIKAERFGCYTYTSSSVNLELQQELDMDISLTPQPQGAITGTVTNFSGQPISDVMVTLLEVPTDSDYQKHAYTDANGQYTFDAMPCDRNYTFEFSAGGYDVHTKLESVSSNGGQIDAILFGYLGFELSNCDFEASGDWEWGSPQAGPETAHDGTNLWGTNLDGGYQSNHNRTLTTPAYYLQGMNDGEAYLKFYHWLESNEGWDGGNVSISVDGGQWQIINPTTSYPDVSVIALSGAPGFTGEILNWTPAYFDISEYIGSDVAFQFRFASTNNTHHYCGWFIDHFTVYGADITPELSEITDNIIDNAPSRFSLFQNYPNPFNPTTTIDYVLPQESRVQLSIYDVSGKLVKILAKEKQVAGYYSVTWDGTDNAGNAIGSGVYFYKITAGNYQQTKKSLLVK